MLLLAEPLRPLARRGLGGWPQWPRIGTTSLRTTTSQTWCGPSADGLSSSQVHVHRRDIRIPMPAGRLARSAAAAVHGGIRPGDAVVAQRFTHREGVRIDASTSAPPRYGKRTSAAPQLPPTIEPSQRTQSCMRGAHYFAHSPICSKRADTSLGSRCPP